MVQSLLLRLIGAHQQYIRGLQPECCRFFPSCSEYAKQAIVKYGLLRGGFKATGRICRCHPWSGKFGYDPLT